jgi:membrane dipeptidase
MPETPKSPKPPIIVDAHQDIAWNTTAFGRDFALSARLKRQQEVGKPYLGNTGNATTGLPESLLGRVGIIFGTLFANPARPDVPLEDGYETPAQAHAMGMAQVDVYQRLADSNAHVSLVRTQRELNAVQETWAEGVDFEAHRVGIVMLMEGADPIREPKAFEEWYARGVRIVGPAWGETRYSGGTGSPGPLTAQGRALLEVMASFRAILDLSHLAEEAYLEAVDRYNGPIIASHSNPRRFCESDRHLSDDMIRRLIERDGVMGMVLYNRFMWSPGAEPATKQGTPLARVAAMIDHVCQIAGSARHVGIGSDFDGGFGVEHIPAELDTVADLPLIGAALAARGYAPDDVTAILGGNFLRVLQLALP